MILEIRTYKVKPGRLEAFVAAMTASVSAVREAGIEVVGWGPSIVPDEGEHAYLVRAFTSVSERDRLENAFYSSERWIENHRESVISELEGYHTVVLDVPGPLDPAVAALFLPKTGG